MAPCPSVTVSVYHKSEFYRNGRTNQAGFWHGGFLSPIQHCIVRKFGYLQNKGTSVLNFVPNSGLRKFRHPRQVDGIVNNTRRRSSLYITFVTVESTQNVAGRTQFVTRWPTVSSPAVTPLLPFVLDLLYNLFYSWAAVGKILSDAARHVVCLR